MNDELTTDPVDVTDEVTDEMSGEASGDVWRVSDDLADDTSDAPVETPDGEDAAEGDDDERVSQLEREGDMAADYLEELLDIADLDGDLDMDVDGDRAAVSIVGADLSQLVGQRGEVLDALQELTRLAVYRETGERSRLMLDICGLPRRPAGAARRAGPRVGRSRSRRPASGSRWTRCRRSSARSCTTRWPRPA